ncbi:MAG: hypothetical protein KBT36_13985 [Kurthia sp.]|nr:hypothetical protein [Candidatus Kurthia equi]
MIHINEQNKVNKGSLNFLLLYTVFIISMTSSVSFTIQNIVIQILAIFLIQLILKRQWQKYFIYILVVIALIVSPQIMKTLFALTNYLTSRLELQYGIDLWQIADAKETLITVSTLGVCIHFLMLYFKSSKMIYCVLTIYVFLFLALQLENYMALFITIMSGLVLINEVKRQTKLRWKIRATLYTFLLVGLFLLIFSINRVGHPIKLVPEKIQEVIEDFRFNKERKDWLREGNLLHTPENSKGEEVAITLMMEQPQAMYLKGFVGSKFDDEIWHDLMNKQALENEALFYWLEEKQFSSQTTLSNLQRTIEKQKKQSVAVQLVNTSTKYKLFPYELTEAFEQVTVSKDGSFENRALLGEDSYTFKMANDVGINYPLFAAQLEEKKTKDTEAYLKLEANYREFVYDSYLQVGQQERLILQEDFKEQSEINYETAISQIQNKLKETITYDDQFVVKDSTVGTVWQTEQKGFSPHYATIGTLAFRLLGIPARYVEGYIVTPEAVEDKKAFEKIDIQNKDAHAWTEIYMDQIGWVPVEVTPKYLDRMPPLNKAYKPVSKAEKQNSLSNKQQTASTEREKTKQIQEEANKIPPQPKKEKMPINYEKYIIIFGLLLLIILLILSTIYILKKRKHVRQLWKEVKTDDVFVQIPASIQLVHLWFVTIVAIDLKNEPLEKRLDALKGKISPQLLKAYEEAFIAYQAQKYGGLEVEKISLVYLAKKELIDQLSLKERWILKWKKGVY